MIKKIKKKLLIKNNNCRIFVIEKNLFRIVFSAVLD